MLVSSTCFIKCYCRKKKVPAADDLGYYGRQTLVQVGRSVFTCAAGPAHMFCWQLESTWATSLNIKYVRSNVTCSIVCPSRCVVLYIVTGKLWINTWESVLLYVDIWVSLPSLLGHLGVAVVFLRTHGSLDTHGHMTGGLEHWLVIPKDK